MNFKKFISENIVDLGDDSTKTAIPPVSKQQRPPAAAIVIPQSPQWQNSGAPDIAGSTYSTYTPDPAPASSSVLDAARKHFKDVIKDYHDKHIQNDYYVFESAKEVMKGSIPLEADRYRIAFMSLSAAGLTKDIIMQTGQAFLAVVDTELNNFSASFDPAFKEQVDDKKALIAQKQQQMMDLSKQMQSLNDDIKGLNDAVIDSETTLNNSKSSFVRAGNEAKTDIQTELQKIDQFIQ